MSKRAITNPREHITTPDNVEFKDLPRFSALINKVRTDNENKRTGVNDEQEKTIQTETL